LAYEVRIKPSASREIRKLSKRVQSGIIVALEALAVDPRPHGVRKLTAADDLYRVRVGDYRVIYQVRDEDLLVLVVKVAHRRDAYR